MMANESYWTFQPASETPSLEQAIAAGAVAATTSETQWHQLSPGMRREIVRAKARQQEGNQ